jgi:hypothetical protein
VQNRVTSLPSVEKAISKGTEPLEIARKSFTVRTTLLKCVELVLHQLKTLLSSSRKTIRVGNYLALSFLRDSLRPLVVLIDGKNSCNLIFYAPFFGLLGLDMLSFDKGLCK